MRQTAVYFLLLALAMTGCTRGPQTVEELTAAGDKAFFANQFSEARSHYLKGLAQKPSDKHLLYFTGMTYEREQIWDSALTYLKRADLLYPNDREVNMALHDVAIETGDYKYAVDAIKALVRLGDPEPQYWPELAELHGKLEQSSAAYYYQRKIVDAGTTEPRQYMLLINVALAVDSPTVAQTYLDSAVARFGEQPEFTYSRAFLLAYQREYDQAEALFRRLLQQDSTQLGYKLGLANVLSYSDEREELRESLELYREVKAVSGDQFKADSIIGVLEQRLR